MLRIEDTDRARLVPESVDKIKESLILLNLKWDEEEHQSKRLDIYSKHLEILKVKKLAYEDQGAWRFKVEKGKNLTWNDVVHGPVKFSSDVIEDFIIVKSDGFPTYHFASVVDDHDLEISHVMRGDEWISSTPKHLLLYEAFGWKHPHFVHLPPILGSGHTKLSKRGGAKSVIEYVEEGYLPEAIVNFLALLGWAPKGDRELFTLDELVSEFSLDRLNKNSPIFNLEKLQWFNQQWLKKLSPNDFYKKLNDKFPHAYASKVTLSVIPLVQGRISTIADFPKLADSFYKKPTLTNPVIKAAPLSGATISQYAKALEKIDWNPDMIRAGTAEFARVHSVETKDLYRSLGVATFGNLVTPPLPESVSIIGKEETLERVSELAKKKK